jgi:SEC-C motif-containing protein
MTEPGRNWQCPCGSGLKYKRCCLRRNDEVALDALEAERVWDRMQSWALDRFDAELGESLKGYMDRRGVGSEERPANDEDMSLALCWLLIDRELADGGTPARLYSELPDLTNGERCMAQRIAASRLGLYRVREVERGAWIDLENVLDGSTTRVTSPNVSREAVRWHVLMCRVMTGGPSSSLWGAAGFYEPVEERALIAELQRIADARNFGAGGAGLHAALRAGAGELVCFVPPSRCAEPVPYTLEGDPVAVAEATWRLRDPSAAIAALRGVPGLAFEGETEDGAGVTFGWLTPRRELRASRPVLPSGAIIMESGPIWVGADGNLELDDVTSLGTFTVREDRLEFFAMSEARLAAAEALVETHVGLIAGRPKRRVRSVDDASRAARHESKLGKARATADPHLTATEQYEAPSAPDARIRDLTYRRWIDDPDRLLGDMSPREAATHNEYRDELELMVRSFEHHSARERNDARPGPEVAWLRAELGLDVERLAA